MDHPQSGGLRIGVHVHQPHPRLDEPRRDKAMVVCRRVARSRVAHYRPFLAVLQTHQAPVSCAACTLHRSRPERMLSVCDPCRPCMQSTVMPHGILVLALLSVIC
jgi:hypothetical protein